MIDDGKPVSPNTSMQVITIFVFLHVCNIFCFLFFDKIYSASHFDMTTRSVESFLLFQLTQDDISARGEDAVRYFSTLLHLGM